MFFVAVNTFPPDSTMKTESLSLSITDFLMTVQTFLRGNPLAERMTLRTVFDAGNIFMEGAEFTGGQKMLQDIVIRYGSSDQTSEENDDTKKTEYTWCGGLENIVLHQTMA